MKITLSVKNEGKTIHFIKDLNLQDMMSKQEIEVLDSLFLKLFYKPQPIMKIKECPKVEESQISDLIAKFKVGDYVRVIANNNKMMNHAGSITKSKDNTYYVEFEPNVGASFFETEIELTPKKISKKDIFKKLVVNETPKFSKDDIVRKLDKTGRKGRLDARIYSVVGNSISIQYIKSGNMETCKIDQLTKVK